jgi:alpha-glucosidase
MTKQACAAIVGLAGLFFTASVSAAPVTVTSPDSKLAIVIDVDKAGQLIWRATMNGGPVIEASPLGIVVDGTDLGNGVEIQKGERYGVDEKYPWYGVHSTAVNKANGSRVAVRHAASGQSYVVEVRAYNDAVAFRVIVEGTGRRVPDAATGFRLPGESTVWSHGLRDHYEALYEKRRVVDLPEGEWAAPPITVQLPANRGYAAITEADLRGYAGMALQADGRGLLREKLAHDHPPGYPYTLRFGEENAKRLAVAAPVEGRITTPWRVVIAARDLNTLVNSDAVANLCPPPDTRWFPEGLRTAWLKPGRAVWRYLDGGESTPDGIKEFSRQAHELGFEYQVIEGQWAKWTQDQLRDVIDYSKKQGVGLLVWRHRRTLEDPAERRKLFASLQQAGIAGVKVDFLDHEAKEVVELYEAILRDAAEFKLLINFHGANKPAGQQRTWPNEMTREGIYGMEHKSIKEWATFNTTFPFVRMLAGAADYTPVVFGDRRRETSWAHQIASAAILTSPLLVYSGNPSSLLANPAAEVIKSIPSVWDETIVLPTSAIGELALFARRSGDRWFVAAMNGPAAKTVKVDLSFLGNGEYKALVARDKLDDPAAIDVETRDVNRKGPLEVAMRPAGGFVVVLSPSTPLEAQMSDGMVASEFVFETAPFASAHASTIAETKAGPVAAWFGGTREGAPDVGIWVSRRVSGAWTPPVEVATGVQADGTRHPCWNPVLFELSPGTLTLFYKVGPTPRTWWGMTRTSRDNGQTWSEARRLPDGILGPVKNKPVRLADGSILSPSSTESNEQPSVWRVHFERSPDGGQTWTVIKPAAAAGTPELDAIQPSILRHSDQRLQAVGRSRSQRIFETWSSDGGRTWSALTPSALPNPSAGTDASTLRDGRHLIVYNHTPKGRSPLNVAVSRDGKVWEAALALERDPGEYSYPAIIQTADGLVHVTYTWKRQRIKHVVIDPARLKPAPMPDGRWPM